MATELGQGPFTNTLSTTVADTVNFTTPSPGVAITNHDASISLYVRQDGVVAVSEADGCTVIRPSTTTVLKSQLNWRNGSCQVGLSIVGSGNKYTAEAVN